ncbi:hypothetical protein SLA2020_353360 [Shorea laevis]
MPINVIKPPNSFSSLPSLLRSCKTPHHLGQVHAHIVKKGLEQDHFLITLFISIAASLSYCTSIFDRVLRPSICLWNILLKRYSSKPRFVKSVSLFMRMRREGGVPDKYTYPSVIKACSTECKVWEGRALHGLAVRSGLEGNIFVGTSLVDLYGKCMEILSARKVFGEMRQKNVVSWTALVVGYVSIGDFAEAKRVFDKMPQKNVASWNALIGGLVKLGDLNNAKRIFDQMPEKDVVSYTIMIDGYAKAGDMATARSLFKLAPKRDIVAWSALISGYAQNGDPYEAIKIFTEMDATGIKPDEFIMVSLMSACSKVGSLELATWVDSHLCQNAIDLQQSHVLAALLDMHAKCGNMDGAIKLFEEMPKRDVVSYCSMIQGLSIHSRGAQAVELFNRMLHEGLIPDEVAFTVILNACSHAGLVEEGRHYFRTMKNEYSLIPTSDHYACMVDLLSRTGWLKEAYKLLKSMPGEPHAGAWGALLGACKLYCNVELGEVVASRLFEIEPLNPGNYVLLSNIYAAAERWLDVSLLRNKMREQGVKKIAGCTRVYQQLDLDSPN